MTVRIKCNITLLFSPPGRRQRADGPGPGVFGSVAPCTRSRCGANTAIPQWLPSGGQEYNPLWSGHSFRPKIPILSTPSVESRNPLWSGHSFRPYKAGWIEKKKPTSQSPLVGAFVPALRQIHKSCRKVVSQSPLVGAFVPAKGDTDRTVQSAISQSQSPLVGAFVPADVHGGRGGGRV